MFGFKAKNAVVALEEHPRLTRLLFPELVRRVIVCPDQLRNVLPFPEGDANRVLALLTASGESQIGRIVRVAEGEAPLAPLLETERRFRLRKSP
jgi:hypothetical protein